MPNEPSSSLPPPPGAGRTPPPPADPETTGAIDRILTSAARVHRRQASWHVAVRVLWWTIGLPIAVFCWGASLVAGWSRRAALAGAGIAALTWIGIAVPTDTDDNPTDGDETAAEPAETDTPADATSTTVAPAETTTSTIPETTTTETAPPTTASTTTTTTRVALLPESVPDSLSALTVFAPTEIPPYERDAYQPDGWPDSDGDCQNDRHEVLAQESLDPVTYDESGCFVETGRWIDPYDGSEHTSASDVSIDHVVPLAHAHRIGAGLWDDDTQQAFAADLDHPGALIVVGQASNQAKADSSPATWRPTDPAAWCRFAVDWIHSKTRWALPVESEQERDALTDMLATCDTGDALSLRPDQLTEPSAATVVIAPTTTTTTTTIVPEGEAQARIVSCSRRAETVTISNDGAADLSLSGYRLHDEGSNHTYTFPTYTLGPGETVTITTGPDAASGDGFLLWKNQNVWNNDGDTAFLILPDGTEINRRCS